MNKIKEEKTEVEWMAIDAVPVYPIYADLLENIKWETYINHLRMEWVKGYQAAKQALSSPPPIQGVEPEPVILLGYPEAARVIHLWLKEFCDENLSFPNMIADAARKAAKEIETLRGKGVDAGQLEKIIVDSKSK